MTFQQIPADFTPGQRVQLAPHTDWWMRGARYGTVTRVTRTRVHVRLDHAAILVVPATDLVWGSID